MSCWPLVAALLAAGCGVTPMPTLPELEVTPSMYLTATLSLDDVADGDRIDLEWPPQGGHVMFVGARVRQMNERVAELRGRLRDAASDAIVAEEARTVSFDVSPEDASVRIPDLRSFANVSNIPVCPAYTTSDLYDRPFVLEVLVTELRSRRYGIGRRTAVPSCRQQDPAAQKLCQCECAAGYMIGKCAR